MKSSAELFSPSLFELDSAFCTLATKMKMCRISGMSVVAGCLSYADVRDRSLVTKELDMWFV